MGSCSITCRWPMECGCLSLPYPLEQRHPKEHEFHCMLGLVSPLVFEIIPQSVMKFIGTVGKCKCISGTSQCAMTGSCHTQRADASMFTDFANSPWQSWDYLHYRNATNQVYKVSFLGSWPLDTHHTLIATVLPFGFVW